MQKTFTTSGFGFHPTLSTEARKHADTIEWSRAFYGHFSEGEKCLWLIDEPKWTSVVRPGNRAFYCPRFPEATLEALTSFRGVMSSSPEVASFCENHGVPVSFLKFEGNPVEAARLTKESLKSQSVSTKAAVVPSGLPILHLCCVADYQYGAFTLGLFRNLKRAHPSNLNFHVLALDDKLKKLLNDTDPSISVYSLSDVWGKDEAKIRLKSVPYQAMTSKARFLSFLVRKLKAPVFFSDVDVFFFESPVSLVDSFQKNTLLLFPQWSDVFSWSRLHGLINSGLVAARPGSEAALDWWADQCLDSLSFDTSQGYYGDQVYLEMIPLYFENVGIYRNLDHNVAPWNRRTLGVHWGDDGKLLLEGGKPVKSFHAAGPDDSGIFEIKHGWDQLTAFFSTVSEPDSLSPLYENTLEQQRLYFPELDRYLMTRALWTERFKVKLGALSPQEIESRVYGSDRWWVRLFEKAHHFYRGFRLSLGKVPQGEPVSSAFWVEGQRRCLFGVGSNG